MVPHGNDSQLHLIRWVFHLSGILSVVGAGALYQAGVGAWILREQEEITIETAEKERFVARKEIIVQELAQLQQKLQELKQNADTVRQRIPEQPFEAEFLKQISQVADEEGLKIVKYDRGSLQRKGTHSEFDVRLSCEGNYRAICGFLDRLGKLSRVATVQDMTVNAGSGNVYPFELSLMLYYGAQASQRSG